VKRSGSERATNSAAMLPLAPDLFSTTTCWRQISESRTAAIRAVASIPPPAASGQTMRTNCVGHLSACAASGHAVAAIAIPVMKSRLACGAPRSLRPRQSQFQGYHTCQDAGSAPISIRKAERGYRVIRCRAVVDAQRACTCASPKSAARHSPAVRVRDASLAEKLEPLSGKRKPSAGGSILPRASSTQELWGALDYQNL